MRSLRHIKKDIAKAPIHVDRQADETVFNRLLQELPDSPGDSVGWRMPAGLRIAGQVACLASALAIVAVAIWILHARHASYSSDSPQVAAASTSGVALLTEISLERAFRRGGIQAVEDQCREAVPTSVEKPVAPSFEELLAELAGNGEKMGGTSL